MAEAIQNPTGLLFHYTTNKSAIEHILREMLLKMGKYSKTNDPKESKEWEPFVFIGSRKKEFWPHALDSREEILRVQHCTRILCLTLDCEGDLDDAAVERRGYGLSRMWTQYAGDHTGVCMILDAPSLGLEIQATVQTRHDLLQRQVRYADLSEEYRRADMKAFEINVNRVEELGIVEAIRQHVQIHADTFFFKKAHDWRDEREYRWVYCGQDDDSEILVPIKQSLRQVVLGVNFPRESISMVEGFCQRAGVRVTSMCIYRGHFEHSDDNN